MIKCVCDICKQDFPVEVAVQWRGSRKHYFPVFEELAIDVCEKCQDAAHEACRGEHERARQEAGDRIVARLKAMVP